MCQFCENLNLGIRRKRRADERDVTPSQADLTISSTVSMCIPAYIDIRRCFIDIKNVDVGSMGNYLSDYIKIYAIMSSEALILQELRFLNDKIKHLVDSTPPVTWLRLSSILSGFEAKCHFQQAVLIPLGFLPPVDFLNLIRLGYVLKDYGADVLHGEFTHRLQWFVICSIITGRFSSGKEQCWNHTPIDLYTRCAVYKLWGFLLDRNGDAKPGEPRFSHPDELNRWLNSKGDDASIGKLCSYLAVRNRKRGDELLTIITEFIFAHEDDVGVSSDVRYGTPAVQGLHPPLNKLSPLSIEAFLERLFTGDQNDPNSAFHPFDRFKKIEGWLRKEYLPGIPGQFGSKDDIYRQFTDGRNDNYSYRKIVKSCNKEKNRIRTLYSRIREDLLAPVGTSIDTDTRNIEAMIKNSEQLQGE